MPDKSIQSKQGSTVASQVADRIRNSENVLVALSKNPSVDELSAALGLTFVLDKMGKHATAIFSGNVPNAIEFLEPEKTFESNTNSLQDFIIALDKEKADHLRYKIEGDFVRVFITPYRTTLSEDDLEFSHGDFNVDLIIALNVAAEADLDSALSEYGRIKHDASSINISAAAPGNFADLEWGDPGASSVSEMVAALANDLEDSDKELVDKSTATALLAGIVSATNRFSNEHTSAETMAIASDLMTAGADQQLISSSIPVDILTRNVVDANEELKDVEKEDETEITIARNEAAEPVKEEPKPEEKPVAEPVAEEPKVEEAPTTEEAPKAEPVIEPPVAAPVVEPEPQPEEPKVITRPTPEPIGEPSETPAPAVPDFKMMPAAEPEKDYPTAELPTIEAPVIPMHDETVPEDAVPVVPAPVVNEVVDTPTTPPQVAAPFSGVDPAQPPVAPMTVAEEPAPVAGAELVEPPLPMPGDGNILPPPPIPFDPGESAPVEPIMPAPVVDTAPELAPNPIGVSAEPDPAEPIAPITPAILQEEDAPDLSASPSVNGVNPVMQDQVYNDPGAFQIPGAQ
jgi:hypothetical protein